MRETIDAAYPGTGLAISEWNFGADTTMNGALAIADVLGIYGRYGVELAAYWRHPPVGSPGYFAFKMHGNYDGHGSRFGGAVVPATSSDPDSLSAYAAVDDDAGVLRVMLINQNPATDLGADLGVEGLGASSSARTFSYGPADPAAIASGTADLTAPVVVPASSIVVLEVDLT
jgi:hypothetical protein